MESIWSSSEHQVPGRPRVRAGVTARRGAPHGQRAATHAGASAEGAGRHPALRVPSLKFTEDVTGGERCYSVVPKSTFPSVNKGTAG